MTRTFSGNHSTTSVADFRGLAAIEAEPLLTDREGAQLLNCGRSTFWRWASEGVIPKPLKIGGMSRWKLSELQAVIAKADAQREVA